MMEQLTNRDDLHEVRHDPTQMKHRRQCCEGQRRVGDVPRARPGCARPYADVQRIEGDEEDPRYDD